MPIITGQLECWEDFGLEVGDKLICLDGPTSLHATFTTNRIYTIKQHPGNGESLFMLTDLGHVTCSPFNHEFMRYSNTLGILLGGNDNL